jgi:hypothetical protein
MSAAKYDLVIPKGEDYNFTLRILDAVDQPVPFGASLGKAEIREADKKPLAAAFTITSLGDGTLKFVLTKAQTLTLDTNKKYKWDFFWTDASSPTQLYYRLLYGSASVVANITNLS